MFGWLVGGYVKPALYGLAALTIAVAAWWLYSAGYDRATMEWSALYNKREAEIAQAVAAETNRIQQANAMAKAAEAKRLAELAAENAALEQRIKELSDEADADPDRDRSCLSDDSRLRVDSIH